MGTDSFTFTHGDADTEGIWDTFETAIRAPGGKRKKLEVDTQCRSTPPHVIDELREPYLEPVGDGGPDTEEAMPPGMRVEYLKDLYDHMLQALGTAENPEHPHGLKAVICGRCKNAYPGAYKKPQEYGVQECRCGEPEQRQVEWPMKRDWKFLLVKTFARPAFEQHVRNQSLVAGQPEEKEAEQDRVEEAHLEPAQPS